MPCYWLLLVIAAVPQLGCIVGVHIPLMVLVSIGAMSVWCWHNWRIPGIPIVAIGVTLNLLTMLFHNGGMPVRADILADFGHAVTPGTWLPASKDIVVSSSTLVWLSDWLIISLGARTIVVSPGDLFVIAGIVWWLLFSPQRGKDQNHGVFQSYASQRSSKPRLAGAE
jgi:hypothetical protein